MSTRKKILIVVLGVEVIAIVAVIGFLFYLNSGTVKLNRQLELARRYLSEEDYEQAINAFETVVETDPGNVEAYLGLAEAYTATDDWENVVRILEKGSERTGSEEVREMLNLHIAGIEQREQAAQEAASRTAEETADASRQDTAGPEIPTPEPETVRTGFVTQDDGLYYYDEAGNLVTGWFETDGNRYCAGNDGRLYRDGEHEIDSIKYLFDREGVCLGEKKDEAWKQAYMDTIREWGTTDMSGNADTLYVLSYYTDSNDNTVFYYQESETAEARIISEGEYNSYFEGFSMLCGNYSADEMIRNINGSTE